ncbi:MAG: 50S ribosomal protein L11 methyltransferase [Campylobacterales bacterium]
MGDFYYEIRIKVDQFQPEVESFLLDRLFSGLEERDGWIILRSEEPLEGLERELKEYLNGLEGLFDQKVSLSIEWERKENRDWIESYKQGIKPVEVGEFYIRPSWHPRKPGKIDIVIDPALAFGSGHHETTRGVLQLLPEVVEKGVTLLDVGAGSGILGIAAGKLGAVVSGCDTDPLAVEAVRENSRLNRVQFRELWEGSIGATTGKYQIVVANITGDILSILAPDLKRSAEKYLILSGITSRYRNRLIGKLEPEFRLKKEIQEGGWYTLLLERVKGRDEEK